ADRRHAPMLELLTSMSFTVRVDAAARDANVNVYAPRFSKIYPSSEKVMPVTIFHRISAPLVLSGFSESGVALHQTFGVAQAHVKVAETHPGLRYGVNIEVRPWVDPRAPKTQ